MEIFGGDKYTVYVASAYLGTVVILGALIWSTLRANARARRELDQVEREHKR